MLAGGRVHSHLGLQRRRLADASVPLNLAGHDGDRGGLGLLLEAVL